MSDVSEAVTQDAIAESLMGEPDSGQTAEATGTETQEVQETVQPELETEEAPLEEAAEDWLPSDQDKVFPDEVYAKYAERYGLSPEQAADPLLRNLLHDKINTDIFVRQQQQQSQQWQSEEFEPEQEQAPEPTRNEAQPLSREQWFQQIDQVIQQTTDPEVAKQFHSDFLRAFGVPLSPDGKNFIETNAQGQRVMVPIPEDQAMRFTSVASKYMLNLISTHLPGMLQANLGNQLSQAYPGFGDMYERSAYAMAWDRVRNSDPQFAGLPAYGSKEFSSTLREAAQRVPGFDEMQFTDRAGKPLPMLENAMRKYSMLAQIAAGQNVDPALLQKAAAAGAQSARRAAVKRAAGNLGSGQSKAAQASSGSAKFQTNTDLFDDEAMELYRSQHGRL